VETSSNLIGTEIFTAGGYSGQSASFSPTPLTDSPAIPDPLALRPAPNFSGCDKVNFSLLSGTQTISPGVYCGGILVGDTAVLKLSPGEYILKDGPLVLSGDSSIEGEHVGFYMTGNTSVFDFGVSTQANLTAPKTGALSGILFYEDRNSIGGRQFAIRSKDAERFEGTVYLPQGTLFVDKDSRIGQLSNWTAMIARRIHLGSGPDLVVNSDYANSDVPVPDGIEGAIDLRLVK
jgi:hypothetical protein